MILALLYLTAQSIIRILTGNLNQSTLSVNVDAVKKSNGKVSDASLNTSTKHTGSGYSDYITKQKTRDNLKRKIMSAYRRKVGYHNRNGRKRKGAKTPDGLKAWFNAVWADKTRNDNLIRKYPYVLVYFPELAEPYPGLLDELSEIVAIERAEIEAMELEYSNIRAIRIASMPNTFTDSDWQFCLGYFDHACVVCGGTQDLHRDHWIPVYNERDCPGTIPENIVPLCQTCNSSKGKKNATQWLKKRVGNDKAIQIANKVSEYFNYIKKQKIA